MNTNAKQKIKYQSKNNKWLFDHMITAFWHGFGISNGLDIEKDDIEVVKYKRGKNGYRVKPEVMQAKLKHFIEHLKNYQNNWNSDFYDDMKVEDFYKPLHESRKDIVRMIELLQI